jgi:hypothetical protein
MTLLPRHAVTRVVAAIWLLACFAFLLMTLAKSELSVNDRSALKPLVPVYLLALPSAHVAYAVVARAKLSMYLNAGFEPDLRTEAVFLWTLTVTLGYVQWFIVLPWLARRCGRWAAALSARRDEHRNTR